jgi:UDPglucose 6-dehydrogenase
VVTNPSEAAESDLFIIAVPTPTVDGISSRRYVESALEWIREACTAKRKVLIAVRSTLIPGTMTLLSHSDTGILLARRGALFCYWPSFARERRAADDEANPRAIVIGAGDFAVVDAILGRVFDRLDCAVHRLNFESAELAKAATNCFNATKISFFNAVADWADSFGAAGQAVADVISAMAEGSWNPDYGITVGAAFAGACLPKDLDAVIGALAEREASHIELLRAVKAINEHPARSR